MESIFKNNSQLQLLTHPSSAGVSIKSGSQAKCNPLFQNLDGPLNHLKLLINSWTFSVMTLFLKENPKLCAGLSKKHNEVK